MLQARCGKEPFPFVLQERDFPILTSQAWCTFVPTKTQTHMPFFAIPRDMKRSKAASIHMWRGLCNVLLETSACLIHSLSLHLHFHMFVYTLVCFPPRWFSSVVGWAHIQIYGCGSEIAAAFDSAGPSGVAVQNS